MFLNLVWIRVNKKSLGKADTGQTRTDKIEDDRTGTGTGTGQDQDRTGTGQDGDKTGKDRIQTVQDRARTSKQNEFMR